MDDYSARNLEQSLADMATALGVTKSPVTQRGAASPYLVVGTGETNVPLEKQVPAGSVPVAVPTTPVAPAGTGATLPAYTPSAGVVPGYGLPYVPSAAPYGLQPMPGSFDQQLDALGLPPDLVSSLMGSAPPYAPGMIWPDEPIVPPGFEFLRSMPMPEGLRRRRIRIAIIIDRNGQGTVLR